MNCKPPRLTRIGTAVAVALMAAVVGCGAPTEGRVDPTRSPDRAEEALRAALDAWKAGRGPETLQTEAASIAVHDSVWKSGKKLADYTIVDRTDGDVRVDFNVRLALSGPDRTVDQTYYVWGKTPLSVYRKEDFDRILITDRP